MSGSLNVAEFLLAGTDRSRIALHQITEDVSYGQLQDQSALAAGMLQELGGRPGDLVVLIGENSCFWAAAYLGTLRAGLVSVPLPPGIPARELDYILKTTEARIIFVEAGLVMKYRELFPGRHVITDAPAPAANGAVSQAVLPMPGPSNAPLSDSFFPAGHNGLAALMFTSGSTGKPRGVMVSHGNIVANTESILRYLGLDETDRMMTVLPFHYCFGTSLLHTHLRAGAGLVVGSRFLFPETVLDRMLATECTGFAGVPSHFQILLRNSSLRKRTFPHLRHVQQAGGSLPAPFIQELREALPRTKIFIMYGQTEATARLSYLPPELLDTRMGSIGKGIPGVTLRLLDESGQEAAAGEVGEIVAEGENIALGYWGAPEETASVFRNGTLHTGDLGRVDEDGFLYVVGRTRDFLKCRGERVSCRQIEDVLLEFDDLLEVSLSALQDPVLGEAVQAFAVFRQCHCADGCHWLECREVRQRFASFCKEHLPQALVPKRVTGLPELPKNGAGKVLKANLQQFA